MKACPTPHTPRVDSMAPKPRDYQAADISKIMLRLGPGRRIMYFLPTGGGKTTTATHVALRWTARSSEHRIAWLTHRTELAAQSESTLRAAQVPEIRTVVISPVRLMNAIKRGEIRPSSKDLLIVDEAHHAPARVWAWCVNNWPGAVLGLSATPWRLSKHQGLDHIFEAMIYGPTKSKLIENGYLTPSLVKRPPDTSVIHGRGSDGRGDYSTSRTISGQAPGVLIEKAIEWLAGWERAYGKKLKTLIYCLNINHAEAVARHASSVGIPTETLFANTPRAERLTTVERYRTGATSALANVGILTEGFDAPDTDCVLCLRPTQSLSLWVQMAGRANRLSPGKTHGLILDGTTNTERLGHPDTDFDWTLKARGDEKSEHGGESPARRCPNEECQTINGSGAKRCSECQEPFGMECPMCGWVFGTQTEDGFIMPELDPIGRCERCSLGAQERRFGAAIPTLDEFRALFSANRNDNLTYVCRNSNLSFWIRPGYDDMRGRANSRGGAYLGDPGIAHLMPPGVSAGRPSRNGSMPLNVDGESSHRRRRPDDVMQFLYERVYYPAMINMTDARPVREIP